MYTLKISALYLLPSSRKLTKTAYVDILKHVEITKFQATYTNDTPFDRSLKVVYTLKISTLYLLPSSRKLTKSVYVDILKHVEIIKFSTTSKCDISFDSLLKY